MLREPQNAPVPFDAQPAALHYRLQAVEDKIDNLPNELVLKLKGAFLTPEEHARICQSSKPPEPKPWDLSWLRSALVVAAVIGTMIGAALGLVPLPASGGTQPQVAAPK